MSFQRPIFVDVLTRGILAGIAPRYIPGNTPTGAFVWGINSSAQLGLGTITPSVSSPTQLPGTWTRVGGGQNSSAGIKSDGTLWTWGSNNGSVLGIGNPSGAFGASSPVQVFGPPVWSNVKIQDVNGFYVLATGADNTLWGWGLNSNNQVGNPTTTTYSAPVQVGSGIKWSDRIATSLATSAAIDTSGNIWTWGNPGAGALGNGTTSPGLTTPVLAIPGPWIDIVGANVATNNGGGTFLALKGDGTIWAWGSNSGGVGGYVGDGTRINRTVPTQIGTDNNYIAISLESHALVVKNDGTMWGWGTNSSGQLCQPTATAAFSSPIQMPGTGWVQCAASNGFSYGIKTDGSLWAWGDNGANELGGATAASAVSSPVQIPGTWIAIGTGPQWAFGKR